MRLVATQITAKYEGAAIVTDIEKRSLDVSDLAFSVCFFCCLCLWNFTSGWAEGFRPYLADDAYYYFIIARHLVHDGRSTFDGASLTNGYQPLWLTVLYLQYKFVSSSLLLTRFLEYALGLGGLVASLASIDLSSSVSRLLYTVGYFFLLSAFSFNGMESGLFCCLFFAYFYFLRRVNGNSPWLGCWDGLAAALVVGARLDSAAFVVLLLMLTPQSWRRKIIALTVLSLCMLAYVVLNLRMFGVGVPVSGQIKSLGGLQWNRMFFSLFHDPLASDAGVFYVLVLFMFIATRIFFLESSRWNRALSASFVLGLFAYGSRILFLSSWKVWIWYQYPVLIGFAVCFPQILRWTPAMTRFRPRVKTMVPYLAVAMLGVGIFTLRSVREPNQLREPGFAAVNEKLLSRYSVELNGATVAMGDRSGEFAFQYRGSVVQTEGLVNDEAYFQQLKNKGDIKQVLCGRGVRYLIAYEPDLGSYYQTDVETIRQHLSQYSAPTIRVRAADEVGRVPDAPEVDAEGIGDVDRFLYLWRLNCKR